MRDEFSAPVRRTAAERVGLRCSNPSCRALTVGPRSDPGKAVNLGVGAHISGASAGGPRYRADLSVEERTGGDNCLWVCQNCAKLIDNDPGRFSESDLRAWKRGAEERAQATVGIALGEGDEGWLSSQEMEILRAAARKGDIWVIGSNSDRWVRSGDVDFQNNSDPAYAAEYCDALEQLQSKDFVRYQTGIHYALTGRGFRIARALSEE